VPRGRVGVALSAIALGAPAGASAAAGSGADVFSGPQCQDLLFGVTFCVEGRSVFNMTTTPSGNVSLVLNGKLTTTITTSDGCVDVSSQDIHAHSLIPDGVFHEDQVIQTIHQSFNSLCGSPGMDCDIGERLHTVDGQDQYADFPFECRLNGT